MFSRCFLDFSVGVRAPVIGLSQISSFSLYRCMVMLDLIARAPPTCKEGKQAKNSK